MDNATTMKRLIFSRNWIKETWQRHRLNDLLQIGMGTSVQQIVLLMDKKCGL
jgi:hypothetical protein